MGVRCGDGERFSLQYFLRAGGALFPETIYSPKGLRGSLKIIFTLEAVFGMFSGSGLNWCVECHAILWTVETG